jgi:hypothetical protein
LDFYSASSLKPQYVCRHVARKHDHDSKPTSLCSSCFNAVCLAEKQQILILLFDEMMIISALYKTNKLNLIFYSTLALKQLFTDPLWRIILTLSQPVIALTLLTRLWIKPMIYYIGGKHVLDGFFFTVFSNNGYCLKLHRWRNIDEEYFYVLDESWTVFSDDACQNLLIWLNIWDFLWPICNNRQPIN